MKTYRVKEEWQRAGVYYVRTQAMVYGFNLTLQGEFADDTPESEYILVTDDNDRPLSTNRIHVLPERGFAKIERVVTLEEARGTGAGRAGILAAEEWIKEKGFNKIVITSREEAVGFYQKLGYTVREDMSTQTLEPKKPGEVIEVFDPRFVCVYTEKEL